ncbi:bifunctional riboflavin kinase/FAD synthetase [Rarobacter incanus]|uniref:Riboflavin biosynthesis protein n=1 Tax=Rarobacter incanus TaxID=153494 RepID=A0A542SLK6_9MICO|nr:bifunctional riboflavin kinase/FAD synthetase [Rarobacter incanus]TQK75448.1 riboflavin kinase/FMN adenylyltransferase [Rarobacter incanus]
MLVFSDISEVPADFGPSVVTIGNFDGVHRGHQEVLRRVVHEARRRDLTATVMTFDPHPARVHRPLTPLARLCSLDERLELIAAAGIDATLVVPYTLDFARQTPQGFVLTYLLKVLSMRAIVAGHDIRFGWDNVGNFQTLQELGAEYGFDVIAIDDVGHKETGALRWSSTLVRDALRAGDVASAGAMLGREPSVRGTIVAGDRRGRELGFPTANLDVPAGAMIPADGVYAGWLTVSEELSRVAAAISVGTNPTFHGTERRVEAYAIGRSGLDLYGKEAKVEFVERVRGQAVFSGVAELIAAMRDDVAQCERILRGTAGR